jgi:hypothetical protein
MVVGRGIVRGTLIRDAIEPNQFADRAERA